MSSTPASIVVLLRPSRVVVATSALAVAALFFAQPLPAHAQDTDEALDQCEDGVRAADAGRWEEAEFRWMKATAIDGAVACSYNNLAIMHERDGEYEEADELYRKALANATGAARTDVLDNFARFRDARISDVVEGSPEGDFNTPAEMDEERGSNTLPVTIAVPEAEGRALANFERILVGPFLNTTPNAPVPVAARAVAYFRRRIVQRSFLQAVDASGPISSNMANPFDDAEMWKQLATDVEADLIFSGRIGLETNNASRLVSERIRAPNGEITEVSRFRNIVKYDVALYFVLLQGSDGAKILDGDLQGSREFATDDEIPADDMLVETLEDLLPQLLDAVTPHRVEQVRILIY